MKTFDEKYLAKIKKVLEFAVNNPYSDFYKNKYKDLDFDVTKINSIEEFQKIPLLNKSELFEVPLEKRTFVPKNMVDHYTKSSGTTSAGHPLVLPHVYFEQDRIPSYKTFDEELLEKLGVKNFLMLRPNDSPIYTLVEREKKKKTKFIAGDVNDIEKTAELFNKNQIQGIVTTPTLLYLLFKELERKSISTQEIKWIWLAGELLTKSKLKYLKLKFPNAWIEVKYGATENLSGLTPRGYQCRKRNFAPNLYHIFPAFFLEIVDGEILQTDLYEKAFPLIRYQTGDYGKIFKKKCACGNNDFLELGGRKSFDVLRAEGMIIYAEVIERAIFKAGSYIEPEWQAHVYEDKNNEEFCLKMIIDIIPKKNTHLNKNTLQIIKDILEENIFLSKGKNLKWFIQNKKARPLELKTKSKIYHSEKKSKNIISHIK